MRAWVGRTARVGGATPGTFVVNSCVVPDLGTLKSCLVVNILAALQDYDPSYLARN